MSPIQSAGEVFDAIAKAKAGATDLRTNFFPVQKKLETWIKHGELFGEQREGAAFFFRRDRDFWRWYFCTANLATLQREIGTLTRLQTEGVMTDLVGHESSLAELLTVLQSGGFRPYARLQRMTRLGQPEATATNSQITLAEKADGEPALALIESLFDRHGEQLPTHYEIASAIENRQLLVAKPSGELAGLLFFETQGFASTIRFWAVAEKHRAAGYGSALIRHYFQSHAAVRRFTLWVDAANEPVIKKYQHYGYAADGLLDQVLANKQINS